MNLQQHEHIDEPRAIGCADMLIKPEITALSGEIAGLLRRFVA